MQEVVGYECDEIKGGRKCGQIKDDTYKVFFLRRSGI